jgi:hypothetical protein
MIDDWEHMPMSRQEKNEAIRRSTSACRADLINRHAKDGEDLLQIAAALVAQAETILLLLLGPEETARYFHAVADGADRPAGAPGDR